MLNGQSLRFGSLFTGVGGFDLGFERAGMRVAFQCEIDAWCRGILAQHWPGVPCFEDVRSVHAAPNAHVRRDGRGGVCPARGSRRTSRTDRQQGAADRVDVLCGGSPCQDLSLAGLRAGLDGDRSGLFFEFARVADELVRPGGWIVFENVPGLLSSPGRDREIGVDRTGRDFAIVLATLADIGFHDLAWRVLDSRYFGVPQRRRRVYIVGRRAVGGSAREVLLEPESGGGNHQTSSQARPRVAASATSGSHSAGVSAPGRRQEDDENIAVLSLDRKGGGPDDNEAQAGHIVADPLVARSSRGRPQPLSAGHNTDGHIVSAIVRRYAKGTDSDATDALVVGTIRSHVRPGSNDIGGIVAHTLRAEGFDASEDGTGPPADANGVRAPAGLPGRVDDPQPDGPRYSAMGNAVTVNVLEWIGRRIVAQCERERVAA